MLHMPLSLSIVQEEWKSALKVVVPDPAFDEERQPKLLCRLKVEGDDRLIACYGLSVQRILQGFDG
jgi:hypothetical protein